MQYTTEKDAVRLQKFEAQLCHYPIYALPIQHQILFNQQEAFTQMLTSFIHSFEKRNG